MIKHAFFLVLLITAATSSMFAACPDAVDLTTAAIQSCIDSANEGDVITLKGGTADLTAAGTGAISINKAITVQGGGIDTTTIIRNSNAFNITVNTHGSYGADSPYPRLSQMTINGKAGATPNLNGTALVTVNGTTTRFRVDHVKINSTNGSNTHIVNGPTGVFDHVWFLHNSSSTSWVRHPNWNNTVDPFGDRSWADGPHFGDLTKFAVFEDCVWSGGPGGTGIDGDHGGRFVIRHSRIDTHIGGHGTESTKRARGTRAVENYNNIFDRTGQTGYDKEQQVRSGSVTAFNNVMVAGFPNAPAVYGNPAGITERLTHNFTPYGRADALGDYDSQAGATSGGSGTVYLASTAAGATTTPDSIHRSVVINIPGTGVNSTNYKNYTIRRIVSGNTQAHSVITSNGSSSGGTPNTMSVTYANDAFSNFPNNVVFAAGDSYDIRQIVHLLDGPGMGAGDLLSGGSDTVQPTPITWPNQATDEGIYSWNWRLVNLAGTVRNGFSGSTGPYTGLLHGGSIRPAPYPKITTPTAGEKKVGPDAEMESLIGTATSFILDPNIVYGADYPHPDAGGSVVVPHIGNGAASVGAIFTEGVGGSYTFTTSGFTNTPNLTKSGAALPSGVSFSTTNGTGQARISGTPAPGTSAGSPYGTVASPITITASATGPTETASQTFSLTVNAGNQAPSASISLPLTGSIYTAPATIPITASGQDGDGSVSEINIYRGGSTFVGNIPSSGGTFTWTTVPAGSYSLTAKSTDNLGSVGPASSPAVAITVASPAPSVTPTPPAQIILQP